MFIMPVRFVKVERYNRETLEVQYRGKSISEVLDMPVTDALEFFKSISVINKKLKTLNDVGLGYIHLGQQPRLYQEGRHKVKLATELSKVST